MSKKQINLMKVALVTASCLILMFAFIDRVVDSEDKKIENTTLAETVHNPEKTGVETTSEENTYLSCVSTESETTTEKMTTEMVTTEYIEPVVYFDVKLGWDLQDHIFRECEKHGIDPAIVIAMIERESDFRSRLVGDNGNSFGLMQINKKWHIERMKKLGVTDLFDPYQNVTVGIDYLAENYRKGGTLEWALMAYNGGPSYARRLTAEGIVSKYAKGVLERSEELNEGRVTKNELE